jgi:diguanylate cyclase (GGDEF)-like protein/PAS domain S-box-containing protein
VDDVELPTSFYRRVLESSSCPIVVFEWRALEPTLQYINRAFVQRTGYENAEILGLDWRVVHGGEPNHQALAALRTAMREGRERRVELRTSCKDGSRFWSELHVAPLRELSGAAHYYVGALRDTTAERARREELEYCAYHDALTGLPNRWLLGDRLEQTAAQALRHYQGFALALVDLDRFKQINDTLGHAVGDGLLQVIAARLMQELRSEDTIARLGGDEFVLLFQRVDSRECIPWLVERIRNEVEQPVMIADRSLSVSCSIGVSLFPGDGMNFDALLRAADRAMYEDKALARDRLFVCQPLLPAAASASISRSAISQSSSS